MSIQKGGVEITLTTVKTQSSTYWLVVLSKHYLYSKFGGKKS